MEFAAVGLIVLALVFFFVLKKKGATTTSLSEEVEPPPGARIQEATPPSSSLTQEDSIPVQGNEAAATEAASPEGASAAEAGATATAADESAISSDEGADEQVGDSAEEYGAEVNSASSEEGSPPPPPSRETASPPSRDPARQRSELQSLRKGLAKSRESSGFFGRLKSLFGLSKEIDPELASELEEILLSSDVGVSTTEAILERIKDNLDAGELKNEEQVWEALRDEARRALSVDGPVGGIALTSPLTVVLLVGVNGAGKTTTIGKLAQQLMGEGKTVMLAAGDTFRAAAVDQLKAWGSRVGCEVVSGKSNADPSSVLFDAIKAAQERGADVLLADTAGRLHTKTNLMIEMEKLSKTLGKALPGAPHEVLLVIDSTNGQNAMAQAREFKEALPVTGLVLTKLDGSARGGVVLGICDGLQIPVRYIGVGERTEDLLEFDTNAFVEALLGRDEDVIAA